MKKRTFTYVLALITIVCLLASSASAAAPDTLNGDTIQRRLNDYPDVMSIDEMCRALSIGKKTGYKLLQTGQIRFLKIGRAYRIPKINLLEYLQVIRPE